MKNAGRSLPETQRIYIDIKQRKATHLYILEAGTRKHLEI